MHPILNIAIRAVRKAGNLITKYYEIPYNIEISKTDDNSFITNIAKYAEAVIIETIHKFYPQHSIFTEETDKYKGTDNSIQWIIDPLDGAVNFIKCLPHFAISIAVRIKGRIEVAVVYDPMRNELFTAIRGQGTQLNGYRLRISNTRSIGAILAIGLPFRFERNVNTYINIISNLLNECLDFRRTGSTTLDLAYVAAGRIDGYFEIGLKPCDFAAGELLVREAGAIICDFTGSHDYINTGNVIAGNLQTVRIILKNIHREINEKLKH